MTSSYSDLGLELMVTGENAGTWGDKTNQNINLIQQAIAGFEQVTLSSGGTLALAMTDETLSNARNMVIKFATASIAASTICTIPDGIEKFYIFDCTGLTNPANLTIKTASGTGFTLNAAKIFAAYSDGTNLNEISLDTLGGTIAAADITGTISTAQIADNAVTTAKISDNQITTAKVSDLQITTAKIADDSVTPAKLSNTAVTAGAYTTANITVDAQGRITSAASGSAGGATEPQLMILGPGSGTYTGPGNGSRVIAYMCAGGGGGGGATGGHSAGAGGAGGYGVYKADITQPLSTPYSVGAGGAGNNGGGSGGAGGATTFYNFTANGGNGGAGQSPGGGASGNSGTAPAAFIDLGTNWARQPSNSSNFGWVLGRGGPGGPGTGDNGEKGTLLVFEG